MKLSTIISLILWLSSYSLLADQKGIYPEIKTDVFFQSYTTEDGLPNKTVNCFAEDEQGFIWIGTLNGLSKFNGETFVNFNTSEDSLSIPHDEINEILVLDEILWLGTAEGLVSMDINSEKFIYYDLPYAEDYSQNIESILHINNELWIGYESNSNQLGGIAVFSLQELEYTRRLGIEEGVTNVHDLYLDPYDDQLLWVASSDLYSYDISEDQFTQHQSEYTFDPLRRGCTSVYRLDKDQLLVGTTKYGLLKYNPAHQKWSSPIRYNQGKSLSFFSPNYVKAMTALEDGRIILNTYDYGLVIYHPELDYFSTFKIAENNPFAIPSARSHKTFIDSKKRLWHGFYSNLNIEIDDLQVVSLYNTGIEGDVSIPIVRPDGIEFFVGNQHVLYKNQKPQKLSFGLNKAWNYAQRDSGGDTYYLYPEALYVRPSNHNHVQRVLDNRILHEKEPNRQKFKFFSIDKKGQIWITTESGEIIIYNKEKGAKLVPIKNNRIGICSETPEASYRVAHGPQETLISHACGILIYDKESHSIVDINDYFNEPLWEAERWTYTIAHLKEQTYLVGSFRQGLHILDLAKKVTYLVSPELTDIIISTITATDGHLAWCMTDAGIICYDHNLGAHKVLTTENGLTSIYNVFQKAVAMDDGRLVLGGPDHLTFINTDKVNFNTNIGSPIATTILANDEVILSNQYLNSKEFIKLNHEQNDIEIRFSHHTSFDGRPSDYYYQMSGLSDSWINTRNIDHVRFFDLAPGKYYLNIAHTHPEETEAAVNSISFFIAPPIWGTYWFRFLAIFSLGSLLYYLYASRVSQIKNQTLLDREEKENDELKSQNDLIQKQNLELQQLNESKDRFFGILAHDIRAPLAAFSGLGKQLNYHIGRKNYKKIEVLSDHIQHSSEKLTGLVDNLLNWSLLQTGKFEYDPQSVSLGEVTAIIIGELHDVINQKEVIIHRNIFPHSIVRADSQSIHIIIRNILSNAIKFSHVGGEININSSHENGHVDLTISDQGVGMSTKQIDDIMTDGIKSSQGTAGELGVGLGLQMCRELAKMNRGQINITANQVAGTSVTISLPIETKTYA